MRKGNLAGVTELSLFQQHLEASLTPLLSGPRQTITDPGCSPTKVILCPPSSACVWVVTHSRHDLICFLTSRFPLVKHRLPGDDQGEEQNAEDPHAAHKDSIHIEI